MTKGSSYPRGRTRVILDPATGSKKFTRRIDSTKYEKYADETKQQYLSKYPWRPLSPTLHRVLDHGGEFIRHYDQMGIPLGMTTEEGSEGNNKFIKRYHQHHSRKIGHKEALSDTFNRAMDESDPIVLHMYRQRTKDKKDRDLPSDVQDMLMQ